MSQNIGFSKGGQVLVQAGAVGLVGKPLTYAGYFHGYQSGPNMSRSGVSLYMNRDQWTLVLSRENESDHGVVAAAPLSWCFMECCEQPC